MEPVAKGDVLALLNKGGVIGESEGWTVGLGEPSKVEIWARPMRDGQPLRLTDYAVPRLFALAVADAAGVGRGRDRMNAGKSTAASVIIHHLANSGKRVHAAKVTGVAAMADLLSFSDSGAHATMNFVDAGLPSTCYHDDIPQVARTVLGHMAEANPDVIVVELGDGLLGAYGVDAILDDPELVGCFRAAVVAANDVIGGWCAAERLRERGIQVAVITGPATDNNAGRMRLGELGYAAAKYFSTTQGRLSLGLSVAGDRGCRMTTTTVGIVGASGFLGGELVRLCATHPQLTLTALAGRDSAGRQLASLRAGLAGVTLPTIEPVDPERLARCAVVFTAMPHGESAPLVQALVARGVKVIDVGSDFRLRAIADHETYYQRTPPHPELLEEAFYGLPELTGSPPPETRIIACPGCFATALALAIVPLVPALAPQARVAACGITGSSGSGIGLSNRVHHALRQNNLSAYKPLVHQHLGELRQLMGTLAQREVAVDFVPHSGPFVRGIHLAARGCAAAN